MMKLIQGDCLDTSQRRKLLDTIYFENKQYLWMNRTYEDEKNRFLL